MAESITTSRYRIGRSADPANNFDLEPDGAGSLLIKRVSDGLVQAKIDANGNLLGKVPAFRVSRAANQPAISGDYNKVLPDSVQFDNLNAFNLAQGRYQPTIPGLFHFAGNVFVSASSNPTRVCSMIYKNGAPYAYGNDLIPPTTGSAGGSGVTSSIPMNGTTDYVELWAFMLASTALISGSTTLLTHFEGHLVSANL